MFAYLVYIQYFSPRPPAKTLSSIKQVSQFENHQARSGIEVTGLKISWQVSDFIFTLLAESWKAAMVMYGSHGFLIHCKMQLPEFTKSSRGLLIKQHNNKENWFTGAQSTKYFNNF